MPKPETGAASRAAASGDAPGVKVWTPATALGGMAASTYFAAERDAYAAAFAVSRDGRLRVVWPESPKEDGMVRGGKTYRANASYTQYGGWAGGPRAAVPFVFVLTSDQRLDLTRFARGSNWAYQVNLADLGYEAEDALETVAEVVLPTPDAPYAADFAYVGPRLTGQAAMLAMQCGVRAFDQYSYNYFRDMWAVFDPWDTYLGPPSFHNTWMWSGLWFPYSGRSMQAFYIDRASRANSAFWGLCPTFNNRTFLPSFAQAWQAGAIDMPNGRPTPAIPGDVRDTTTRPGDSLKVKPSEVLAGPGARVAAGGSADERRARLRERLLGEREERLRPGGPAAERRAAFRAERVEQLSRLDVPAVERRMRAAELAASGVASAFDHRTGRARWNDPAFGRTAGLGGRGGVVDDFGRSGAAERARASAAERARSGAERSGADRAIVGRGDGGGATRSGDAGGGRSGGGEGRSSGGEGRGSGGEGRSRTP
ncbi:hypothetical protein PYV61_10620 [Roseisolibacter sp. H3M3-2]|nr:hypothetical protein [Roseisolibacter sp. H3M3-2]